MINIKLTPDWVFSRLTMTICFINKSTVCFQCDADNYAWVKLAADSLEVDYTDEENEVDGILIMDFYFNAEDIEKNCPLLWIELKELKS